MKSKKSPTSGGSGASRTPRYDLRSGDAPSSPAPTSRASSDTQQSSAAAAPTRSRSHSPMKLATFDKLLPQMTSGRLRGGIPDEEEEEETVPPAPATADAPAVPSSETRSPKSPKFKTKGQKYVLTHRRGRRRSRGSSDRSRGSSAESVDGWEHHHEGCISHRAINGTHQLWNSA